MKLTIRSFQLWNWINAGEGIIKKRKKYKRIDLRPKTLVDDYGQQGNVTDYLRRGSYNVELNV